MAKLGGIRFGAAPLPAAVARPPPRPPHTDEESTADEPAAAASEESSAQAGVDVTEEEEERARKERISAKLAGMGGMRIGMMPLGVGALPSKQSPALNDPEPARAPQRAVPPPRPAPPPETDSEHESQATSEDGVKVEAEESEMEEVDFDDAEELEEVPPPVPTRGARYSSASAHTPTSPTQRASQPPPVRPPVPSTIPSRKSSTQTAVRKSSTDSASGQPRRSSVHKPQAEYVMVEEPRGYDEFGDAPPPPPPPPARPTSRPPPRGAPPLSQPSADPPDSISSQWELPNIPSSSLEFGGDTDLSLSWTDASNPDPTPPSPLLPPPPPPPHDNQPGHAPAPPAAAAPEAVQLSSDELMAVWGRVGVQICEAATSLFEKSKKALVGDGTHEGFVRAALSEVPNAAVYPPPSAYGYLVYVQAGGAVQRRASEIMPGDIVELHDARFKGHKGIHTYSQSADALVGVVSEFEPKKSKIRVFQANQHVGQQVCVAFAALIPLPHVFLFFFFFSVDGGVC